jgi:oxygen-dependent protoporphyrinogen oxidase
MSVRVAVVGGGISGLACAHALSKEKGFDVTVLEAGDRIGGKIFSDKVGNDLLFEGGPDSFITAKPWALALVRELGMEGDLLPTHPEKKDVYIYSRGKMRRLPDGLMLMAPTKVIPFLASDLVDWPTKLRMGMEMLLPGRSEEGDESMGAFARRRFGDEALEIIVGPILAGIFAGDPDALSMASTFPQFVELEKKHRSLILGMRAVRRPPPKKGLTMFMTLKGGLSSFASALCDKLPEGSVRTSAEVISVAKSDSVYTLKLSSGEEVAADRVVLCAPANKAAVMLSGLNKDLASEIAGIPFSTTATVSMAYSAKGFSHPLDGFGFVVDRREKRTVMAATYSSTKFPGRVPQDKVLIRCFLGGAGREASVSGSDKELIAAVRSDIKDMIGVTEEPLEARTYLWRSANPQYNVGHADRVNRIEKMLELQTGLVLAGASYKGVGIPDCVRSGQDAARQISESEGACLGAVC